MLLSIIIKALNEERHIERAIESAIAAAAEVEGGCEIILADSLSVDNTIELARRYPIRILQLQNAEDRSCGAGGQIGWQGASGAFVYILDGDMELQRGFLPAAIEKLRNDPRLAGVAGLVREMVLNNHAFRNRAAKGDTSTPSETTICLSMGGLYRAECIREVGYFTNRSLQSFEEFELGIRLVSKGWSLMRLPIPAVRHFGPHGSSLALMRRRWRSGYAAGNGQLLRQCIGKPYLSLAIRNLRIFRVQGLTLAIWIILPTVSILAGVSATMTFTMAIATWAAILLGMAVWRQSLGSAAYSLVAWHVGIAGLVRGLLTRPRTRPTDPIAVRELQ